MFNSVLSQKLLIVTDWLLKLDCRFIESSHLNNLDYFRLDLEFAIKQHQQPIKKIGISIVDDLSNSHHDLDCAVRNFYAILTAEGKQLLQQRINDNATNDIIKA